MFSEINNIITYNYFSKYNRNNLLSYFVPGNQINPVIVKFYSHVCSKNTKMLPKRILYIDINKTGLITILKRFYSP